MNDNDNLVFQNYVSRITREQVLSSAEIETIYDIEKKSLANFCIACDCDMDWYQRTWLARTESIIYERIKGISSQIPQLRDTPDEHLLSLIRQGDYWPAFRELTWINHRNRCVIFAQYHQAIPSLNWNYLKQLAQSRSVSIDLSTNELVLQTLLRVPVVNYFDNAFSSYVRPSVSAFSGSPYIANHPHLLSTIDVIIESLVNIVFKFNQGLDLKSDKEIDELRNDFAIKNVIALALHSVMGQHPVFLTGRYKGSREFMAAVHQPVPYYFIKCAANYIIDYHEIAHIVLGHVPAGPSSQREIDADSVALHVVEHEYSVLENMLDAGVVGIAIILSVLASLQELPNAASHEVISAKDRLLAAAKRYDPNYCFSKIASAVRYAIEPGLDLYLTLRNQPPESWREIFRILTNER